MRKVFLLVGFFTLTPLIFIFSFILLSQLLEKSQKIISSNDTSVVYAALPKTQSTFKAEIIQEDARVIMVEDYLQRYKSTLSPYAEHIVQTADKYEIDYRLIPAIAMKESTLCKNIPKNSNNCWGYGIYGGKVTRFKDYKEGIEVVTKNLAVNYKQKGFVTPEEIMSKYTPQSQGTWAETVNLVMSQLVVDL